MNKSELFWWLVSFDVLSILKAILKPIFTKNASNGLQNRQDIKGYNKLLKKSLLFIKNKFNDIKYYC